MERKNLKCYIRLNNKEIIDFLIDKHIPHNDLDDIDKPWIAYNHGLWISIDPIFKSKLYKEDKDFGFDCGTDIELFKALLNYDETTDMNQYFVSEKEERWVNLHSYIPKGTLVLSLIDKYPVQDDYHRASIEEIVNWFRNRYIKNKLKPDFNLLDKFPELELYGPDDEFFGKTNNQLIFDEWRSRIAEVQAEGFYFKFNGYKYGIDKNGTCEENILDIYTDILLRLI